MVRKYVVTGLTYRLVMVNRASGRETLRRLDATNAVGGVTVAPSVQGTLVTDPAPLLEEGGGPAHQGGHLPEEVTPLQPDAALLPGALHLGARPSLPAATPLLDHPKNTDAGQGLLDPPDHPDTDAGPDLPCLQGPAPLFQPALDRLHL